MIEMSRGYYTPDSPGFQYTGTGDSSSGGGSGSGMECLQLRSPPAPFHYLLSEQAKSLVALQELQNEVGALLEFRDLVIEAFPNLRSKLSGGPLGGTSPGLVAATGGGGPGGRRDWEPGVRVRRKLPAREADSLPRSRSDSHSKPQAKSEGAHSVVQDSGFSTETSSSKEAHSTAAPPTRQVSTYEGELWQLLDVIQHRGGRLREEAEALRSALGERRALSLDVLRDQSPSDPAEDFRRALDTGTERELAALRRERDLLLDRLAELEAEALAGRVEAERLRTEHTTLRLDPRHDYEERTMRPSAPGPQYSVFTPVAPETPTRRRTISSSTIDDADALGVIDSNNDLGKLDRVLETPVRNIKVKTPDSRKITAILRENNPIELQRHLLVYTVHNQLLQSKLEKIGRSKGTLVERLHRTREENDDLKFQLEEKTIELEGTRAQVRMLESSSRGMEHEGGSSGGPRSMRALQPLPLHLLQSDEEVEPEPEPDIERITDTPRKRPSKIPLPPSKLPLGGLAPKPPTGRSKDTPSYRSRSGDSLGRPSSSQSWRNKNDGSSLSGSKSGNSISSTKSPGGGRNSSFITLKTNGKDSLSRSYNSKPSKDSLTGKVRNNDSLSRIRDSALSSSTSVISKGSKKDLSSSGGTLANGKKSAVPVRRASSGTGTRLPDGDSKISYGVLPKPWKRWSSITEGNVYHDSLNSQHNKQQDLEPQILRDFIMRSDQLAKDKRLYYLSSDYFHRKFEMHYKKDQIDFAYESPNSLRMLMNNVNSSNKLNTLDINTLHSSPTKSDIAFFNEPVCRSYVSLWSKKPNQYFDSISHSGVLNSNCSTNLHSVTNDSIKREGLAECDSLDRHIVSFDDVL